MAALKSQHPEQVTLTALWALWDALRDVAWRDVPEAVRRALRAEVTPGDP